MLLPNRHGSSDSYRYGFNGMELDNELKGEGNSYDFGARMFDPRIMRWFAPDPMEKKYPSFSTYNYALNNPVNFIDPDGKEPRWGQLANLQEIRNEVVKVLSNFNQTSFEEKYKAKFPKATDRMIKKAVVVEQLVQLRNHFEANRKFKYDGETGCFKETSSPEANVDRYLYTERAGWIDMHHFAYFAANMVHSPFYDETIESYGGEIIQDYFKDNASGFSYEDLVSNRAGAEFGAIYFKKLVSGEITVEDAIVEYLGSLSPVEPENAPNYDYIPYAATNENRVTKLDGRPLVGEQLRKAAMNAHNNKANDKDKNGVSLKEKIEMAHDEIEH